jgi:hypothetical protein
MKFKALEQVQIAIKRTIIVVIPAQPESQYLYLKLHDTFRRFALEKGIDGTAWKTSAGSRGCPRMYSTSPAT